MFDRLADARVDAWHTRQNPIDRVSHVAAAVTGKDRNLYFRIADWLGMFVAFGAAGATHDGAHSRQLRQLRFDPDRHAVALFERGAGRRIQKYGERAFVERR